MVMTTMISISVNPRDDLARKNEERTAGIRVIRPLSNAVENLKIRAERLEVPRFSTPTIEGAGDIINAGCLSHPPETGCFAV
jgi:hypothetical protein